MNKSRKCTSTCSVQWLNQLKSNYKLLKHDLITLFYNLLLFVNHFDCRVLFSVEQIHSGIGDYITLQSAMHKGFRIKYSNQENPPLDNLTTINLFIQWGIN